MSRSRSTKSFGASNRAASLDAGMLDGSELRDDPDWVRLVECILKMYNELSKTQNMGVQLPNLDGRNKEDEASGTVTSRFHS